MKKAVKCPDCHHPIKINNDTLEVGDIIECQYCGTELEILSLQPLKTAIVEEEK